MVYSLIQGYIKELFLNTYFLVSKSISEIQSITLHTRQSTRLCNFHNVQHQILPTAVMNLTLKI